jgi:hypothetical protein
MNEKLKNTYAIMDSLEDLSSKKFISEDIKNINKLLNGDLLQYALINKSIDRYRRTHVDLSAKLIEMIIELIFVIHIYL